jgi:DNA-binding SARP family transcriptional activator/tetratricopeptide (TPR) repeat protein
MSALAGLVLLGGFEVRLADRTLTGTDWPSLRAGELVALLALSPERRLHREQVVEALWPHLEPNAGAANVRKAVHHARQALGSPEAVVTRGGQVALLPGWEVECDLVSFLGAASRALQSGQPDLCGAVLAAYGGELLPGAPLAEWSQGPRRQVHDVYLRLLRAAERWDEVVVADPTDERAYQHLMRQALADGLRPAALRWYERARRSLAAELGVAPSPVTQQLRDEARAGLVPIRSALVGREDDLGRAMAVLRDAGDRRLGLLAVRGPSGIGKTAFCREVGHRAGAGGWVARDMYALPDETALAPIARLCEDLLLGGRPLLAAISPHVHAVLGALTASGNAPEPPGPVSRHQVVGALTTLLRACADGAPTLLLLDDAQDADEATVDALLTLASSVPDVFVVLAYRPGAASTASGDVLVTGVGRLHRQGRAALLDLGPLSDQAIEELVGEQVRDLDRVVELAAGNPLVAMEIARLPASSDGLGPDLAAALAARFVEVEPDLLDLLRLAALAGELTTTQLSLLHGQDEVAALQAIDRVLDLGVLQFTSGRFRFRDDLVRRVLAESLPPHLLEAAHRRIAERLELGGAPPARLAHHWWRGARPERATPYAVAAAERALELGAFADARRTLETVLAQDPGHPRALALVATALDLEGDPRALTAYDAAVVAAAAGEAEDLRAARGLAQIKQGDPHGALRALEGVRPVSTAGRLALALAHAGAAALGATDPEKGTLLAAAARRLALETGDRASLVIASWAQAAAAHARGELHSSVLTDLRETQDVPHLAVRVFDGHLCITQRFLYGARPYAEVIAFADRFAAEAERLGAGRGLAFAITLRGEAELLSGRLDCAEEDLSRAIGLHRATGGPVGEAHALQRLSEVAVHRGDEHRARTLLGEALAVARVTDIGFHLLDRIYGSLITLNTLTADPPAALAVVEEAERAVRGPLETCPGCRITLAVPAAIACARAGERERAEAYEQATAYLASVVMRLPAWDAAHLEVRAHLAAMQGDAVGAEALLTKASQAFADAGQPLDARRVRTGPHR